MIRGYLQARFPIPAILCHLDMLNYGLPTNNYTFLPSIKMLFDKIPERDVVLFTAMIDGGCSEGMSVVWCNALEK
ncbi:unnamed protein product [Camellia sinensis]